MHDKAKPNLILQTVSQYIYNVSNQHINFNSFKK